jgi:LPS-assembly protein
VLRPGYFVTPKIALHSTHYSLQNLASGSDRNPNRTLPIFSLDSGLVFERDTALFSRRMTQTLEPRLFYVYIPYRDQSALPNFDSAQASLNFAQLFTENRFIGNDRIGDANQVTAALTSRYLEADGAERLRFTIGQRFYFEEQRLNFGAPTSQTRSDLLLAATGQITGTLRTDTTLQYSESASKLSRASAGIRWEPGMRKVLSLQYRRDEFASPERLEQVDVAAQWPLANKWYGVGRVNYSLPDNKVAESLVGVEHKAGCWVFRAVSQRIPTAAGRSATTLFLQLELTGLARLGSNPLEALRRNIPGYQPVN